MAVAQGYGKTVTSGSVFAYDVADTRNSYIGQPTTNLANTNTARTMFLHYGSHAMTFADAPEKGDGWKKVTITTVDGGNDRLSQFPYITSTIGQRTYSVEYDVGTLNTYKWKLDGSGGYEIIPVTGKGKFQFTVTHGSVGSFALFLINQTPATGLNDTVYYRYYQVEDKPTATPFTAGTRSATQGLLPLVGNSTLDLTNVSFDSNAQMTFDGTNDGIIISDSQYNKTNGQPLTVEVVMKPGRTGGPYQDIVVNRSDGLYNWMLYQHASDGSIQMHGANQNKSTYIPTVGQNIHVVATITEGQVSTLYVNGTVQQVVTGYTYAGMSPSLLCIGVFGTGRYEPYLGNIDIAKVYNRALSAAEVGQNYRHYKTRFNLS